MEKRKEKIESKLKIERPLEQDPDSATSDSEEESEDKFAELFDWRAKKSHK